jgi:hypothetical protein
MIWHQAINVDNHAKFFVRFPQTIKKEALVVVGEENGLFFVAPRKDVVKSARILDPQLSRQGHNSCARSSSKNKTAW